MSILDNYKKILQDYKTKVIDEVKERVLGRSENEEIKEDEENKNYFIINLDGNIKNFALPNSYVRVLNVGGFEDLTLTREEFLDRAHWIYGEALGYVIDNLAHAIENLKKHGAYGPNKTPFPNEQALKNAGWKDSTASYANNTIKTSNEPYRFFNNIRDNKLELNKSSTIRKIFQGIMKQQLGISMDNTKGAWQWYGISVPINQNLDSTPASNMIDPVIDI